jgi:hypothetical protein
VRPRCIEIALPLGQVGGDTQSFLAQFGGDTSVFAQGLIEPRPAFGLRSTERAQNAVGGG